MPTTKLQVYGKWFYQSHGVKPTDHAPHKDWSFRTMVPGKFPTVQPADERQAKRLQADVILLGHGDTFTVVYLDEGTV